MRHVLWQRLRDSHRASPRQDDGIRGTKFSCSNKPIVDNSCNIISDNNRPSKQKEIATLHGNVR